MGNVITRNSRTDRRRVFVLGGKVGHVTRHEWQLLKVKRSKVEVTRSRDVSADKNAVTRQWMVLSTSNLVGIINVGVDACGILSRWVSQKLVHCCFWLLTETQCKIISVQHVCRPKLFKNLCLSLVSGVPHFFFRTTPLAPIRRSTA